MKDTAEILERLSVLKSSRPATWKSTTELALMRVMRASVCLYSLTILATVLLIQLTGDRWWLGTVCLFGPRWLGLLPLIVLVPWAIMVRARLVAPLTAAAVLYILGAMGLSISWPWRTNAEPSFRVLLLTCNMHGDEGGWDELCQLIGREQPEIVALQETGSGIGLRLPKGWHVRRDGQLILASQYPIRDVQTRYREEPPEQWPPLIAQYAIIDRPGAPVAVCNIHLTSPHFGLADVLDGNTVVAPGRSAKLKELIYLRNRESQLLSIWIETLPHIDIAMGDFNMPVESQIYRRWWNQYTNAFSQVGLGFGYTRLARIRGLPFGVRIDHVLTGKAWTPIGCELGPDVGSDHLPVLAEICPVASPR